MTLNNASVSFLGGRRALSYIPCWSTKQLFSSEKRSISVCCRQVVEMIGCGFLFYPCDCFVDHRSFRKITPIGTRMGSDVGVEAKTAESSHLDREHKAIQISDSLVGSEAIESFDSGVEDETIQSFDSDRERETIESFDSGVERRMIPVGLSRGVHSDRERETIESFDSGVEDEAIEVSDSAAGREAIESSCLIVGREAAYLDHLKMESKSRAQELSAAFNARDESLSSSSSVGLTPPLVRSIRVYPKPTQLSEKLWKKLEIKSQNEINKTLCTEEWLDYFTCPITLGNKSFFVVARPLNGFLDDWLSQAIIEDGLLVDLGNRSEDLISESYPPSEKLSRSTGRFSVNIYNFESDNETKQSLTRWKSSYLSCQKPITLEWFHDMIVKVYHQKKVPFLYCDDQMDVSAMFVMGCAMYQLSLWDTLKQTAPVDILTELLISMRVLLRQALAVCYEQGEFLLSYITFLLERPAIIGLEDHWNDLTPSSDEVNSSPFGDIDDLLNQTAIDNGS